MINLLEDVHTSKVYKILEKYKSINSKKTSNEKRNLYKAFIKILNFLNSFAMNDIVFLSNYLNLHIFKTLPSDLDMYCDFNNLFFEEYSHVFKLLDIKRSITIPQLKKVYIEAYKKFSDDEKKIKIINEFFNTYFFFLISKNNDMFFEIVDIKSGSSFVSFLFNTLFEIYIDLWMLVEALKIFDNVLLTYPKVTKMEPKIYNLIDNSSQLIKRFILAKRHQEAMYIVEKLKIISKPSASFDRFYQEIQNVEKIVVAKKVCAPTQINHPLLLENAFKIGAISSDKYIYFVEKLSKKKNSQDDAKKIFSEYIKNSTFLSLESDTFLKKKFFNSKINSHSLSTTLDYYDSKRIDRLTTKQQFEYTLAYYTSPNQKQVKKYLFVRICSYILSIEKTDSVNKLNLVNKIIEECELLKKIYIESITTEKNAIKFLSNFILILKDKNKLFNEVNFLSNLYANILQNDHLSDNQGKLIKFDFGVLVKSDTCSDTIFKSLHGIYFFEDQRFNQIYFDNIGNVSTNITLIQELENITDSFIIKLSESNIKTNFNLVKDFITDTIEISLDENYYNTNIHGEYGKLDIKVFNNSDNNPTITCLIYKYNHIFSYEDELFSHDSQAFFDFTSHNINNATINSLVNQQSYKTDIFYSTCSSEEN